MSRKPGGTESVGTEDTGDSGREKGDRVLPSRRKLHQVLMIAVQRRLLPNSYTEQSLSFFVRILDLGALGHQLVRHVRMMKTRLITSAESPRFSSDVKMKSFIAV